MKALCLVVVAAILAGCQTTPSPRPDVPASLLICAGEPDPPPKPRTQRDVARYALDLADAGRDCRGKLG